MSLNSKKAWASRDHMYAAAFGGFYYSKQLVSVLKPPLTPPPLIMLA